MKFFLVILFFGLRYLTLYILIFYYCFNITDNLKNNLLKSFEFLNLMDNSYNILFYSFVLVTVQNEKVINFYKSKEEMIQSYK